MCSINDGAVGEDKVQRRRCRSSPYHADKMTGKELISGIHNFGDILVAAVLWAASMCCVIVAGSLVMLA